MRKRVGLTAFAALWTGIGDARPPVAGAPSASARPAGQEEQLTPRKTVGLLTLSYRRPIDLSPRRARSIDRVNIVQGVARLADGRCVRLQSRSAEGGSATGMIEAAPSDCEQLVTNPVLVSGRCAADRANVTIGSWRVGCRVVGRRRSLIVATRTDDSSRTLELASLPGEELIAVAVIGLHDQGIVMTVGIGADGAVAVSQYLWFDGPYRALPKQG